VSVGLGQRRGGEVAGRAADGAKQHPLRIGGDPAAVEIGVQVGVAAGIFDFVALAAFLAQPGPRAGGSARTHPAPLYPRLKPSEARAGSKLVGGVGKVFSGSPNFPRNHSTASQKSPAPSL
jgi:hypothetical protein